MTLKGVDELLIDSVKQKTWLAAAPILGCLQGGLEGNSLSRTVWRGGVAGTVPPKVPSSLIGQVPGEGMGTSSRARPPGCLALEK